VRGFVTEALTFYRQHRVVAGLIAVLSDPSAEVRFWGARPSGHGQADGAWPRECGILTAR
jgi:hypothetical protein